MYEDTTVQVFVAAMIFANFIQEAIYAQIVFFFFLFSFGINRQWGDPRYWEDQD